MFVIRPTKKSNFSLLFLCIIAIIIEFYLIWNYKQNPKSKATMQSRSENDISLFQLMSCAKAACSGYIHTHRYTHTLTLLAWKERQIIQGQFLSIWYCRFCPMGLWMPFPYDYSDIKGITLAVLSTFWTTCWQNISQAYTSMDLICHCSHCWME